jgi:hypothetical protein
LANIPQTLFSRETGNFGNCVKKIILKLTVHLTRHVDLWFHEACSPHSEPKKRNCLFKLVQGVVGRRNKGNGEEGRGDERGKAMEKGENEEGG